MTLKRLPQQLLPLILLGAGAVQAQIPPDVSFDAAFGGHNFAQPVGVRHAGDGSDRKFVIERAGRIRLVDADDLVVTTPFLDIISQVDTTFEGGFLGIAFHPDYANNGRLYVKYTYNGNPGGISQLITRISRFTADPPSADTISPSTEQILLEIPQDSNNHNGGDLHFGPDGYLWIGMGDGGGGNDPCNRGQVIDPADRLNCGNHGNPVSKVLLGKMLRIDIDNTTTADSTNLCGTNNGPAPYAIPADNPYLGMSNRCGEVWAYGKRNPYRFSFDRETGDLWIGDVGQNTWEEINLEPAGSSGGRNYGWAVCEGDFLRGSTSSPCNLSDHIGPVLSYRTGVSSNQSVTGGYRYRGPVLSMRGKYVYGDYGSNRVWFASEDEQGNWSTTVFGLLGGVFSLVGFGEDEAGNLYVTLIGGQVRRLNGITELPDELFEDRFEGP